jgi:hypothetical protein
MTNLLGFVHWTFGLIPLGASLPTQKIRALVKGKELGQIRGRAAL